MATTGLHLQGYGELRPTIPLVILGVAFVLVVLAVVLIARSQQPRHGPKASRGGRDAPGGASGDDGPSSE